jgi:xylulokinase
MADFLAGIDYGTGGAKACVISAEGDVLGFAFEEYPFIHEKPGWSEHDPVRYWEAACRLLNSVVAQSHVNPSEIRGLAVSSALPSMVMVDRDHRPIHRAYNLMDRRATAEVSWLKEHVGEDRIFNISGNRLEDHPTIVNLFWEKNNRPDSFKNIYKALTIDGFITLKLTGNAALSHGSAGFYGVAYNVLKEEFDEKLLDEIGIPASIMPDILRCENVAGEITAEAADATGLAAGTPVAAGQVDFNASCIAAGITEEGDIMSNLGTVGNFGVVHRSTDFIYSDVGRAMINVAFTIDSKNTYITIPSTTTGGQSIRYIRDQFSQYEMEVERVLGVSSYDLLNMQAAGLPPGSEGLVILPFLMGERTPIWDQHARGVIFGLSLNHNKGHIVKAMMEAVAYALYDSYRLIKQSGLKINYPIVFHEGGTASTLWRQIITDVFNTQTILVRSRTGAPMGDAILAGVMTGVFKDYSVAKKWCAYIDPMEPNKENHERYMQYFALFKRIYEHVKDDFKELARLRDM